MTVTPELLVAATGCALAGADLLAHHFDVAAARFGIDTPKRMAYFLPQCAHESGLFLRVEESLNYAPTGLKGTWPTRFFLPPEAPNGRADATRYGRTAAHPADQPGIAAIVYDGRMGNVEPGDGWKYIGRGFIGVTGRDMYTAFNKVVPTCPCVSIPHALTALEYAALSAAWVWSIKGCNLAADIDNLALVSAKINGGDARNPEKTIVGFAARVALTNRSLAAFGFAP